MKEDNNDFRNLRASTFYPNSGRESFVFDIPSVLLNNIIDENGDIDYECEIPDQLIQHYSS